MRRSRLVLWMILCLMLVALAGCGGDESVPDGDTPDGDTPDGDDPDGDDPDGDTPDGDTPDGDTPDGDEPVGEAFQFVVITDTHVRLPGNPDDEHYDNQQNLDNLEDAVAIINTDFADADFVAITGDLAGCLYSDDPADYGIDEPNPAETFKSLADQLDAPYYAVLGNHDYQLDYDTDLDEGVTSPDGPAMEAVWKKVLGIDPYYALLHEGIKMIFLNANRGDAYLDVCSGCQAEAACTGSFDSEQLTWLETELDSGEPAILFLHHPLFTDSDEALFCFFDTFLVEADDPFYDIAETYKEQLLAVFTGHGHLFERDTLFGTVPVYETSSLGDTNGHPENIHVVDVNPVGPELTVSIVRDGVEYWSEMMSGE